MIYPETEEKWVQICKFNENKDICFTDEYLNLMKEVCCARTFACRLMTWWGVEEVQSLLNYFGPPDPETDLYDGIDGHAMGIDPNRCELMEYRDTALPGLDADWYQDLLAAKLVSIKLPERIIKQYVEAFKKEKMSK